MMRTLLLTAIWVIGYSLTAASQYPFKKETNPLVLKFDHSFPFNSKNLPDCDLKSKALGLGQQVEKTKNLAIMPVLKPNDRDNMPVYKPDSAITFTLLIKDCSDFPNKEMK